MTTIRLVSVETDPTELQSTISGKDKCACRTGSVSNCCDSRLKQNVDWNKSTGLGLPSRVQMTSREMSGCPTMLKPNAHVCSQPLKKKCPFAMHKTKDLEPIVADVGFNYGAHANIKDLKGQQMKCDYLIDSDSPAQQGVIDDTLRRVDEATAVAIEGRLTREDSVKFRAKWCFLESKTGDGRDTVMMYPNGPPVGDGGSSDPDDETAPGYRVPMCSDLVAGTAEGEAAVTAYCNARTGNVECACARPAEPVGAPCSSDGLAAASPWDAHYTSVWNAYNCSGSGIRDGGLLTIDKKKCWFDWCNPESFRGRHSLITQSKRPWKDAAVCKVPPCLSLNTLSETTMDNSSLETTLECVVNETSEASENSDHADPSPPPEAVLPIPDVPPPAPPADSAPTPARPTTGAGSSFADEPYLYATLAIAALATAILLAYLARRRS